MRSLVRPLQENRKELSLISSKMIRTIASIMTVCTFCLRQGCVFSEFTGLTVKDLDMENRTINIDHQLQKTGTLVYIDTTKT